MLILAADPNKLGLPEAIIFLSIVLTVLTGVMYLKRRDLRTFNKSHEANEVATRAHRERESKAIQQHAELNALAGQKMKREVELLDIQLQLAKFDMGMRHDHRDHHDLVMEKVRLEIESIKQHIKEQKKRNDEFGPQDH